jgi:ubiquinone/menaquinone biosynthesis C-methylase UbiE
MTNRAAETPSRDHTAWNERMVERYDIERYYRDARHVVRWVEHGRLRAIELLSGGARAGRVLEVGVGGGHVLERFAGATRAGLDLSPLMLQRARARLGAATPLIRGSADALPIADGSFDTVICTEVLEHTPDPGAVLRELVRVAGDGAVIVSIPNEANIDRVKRLIRRLPLVRHWLRTLAAEGNEWHLHHFDLQLLRQVAAGVAEIEHVVPVPNRLLPVRYVARLRGPTAGPMNGAVARGGRSR